MAAGPWQLVNDARALEFEGLLKSTDSWKCALFSVAVPLRNAIFGAEQRSQLYKYRLHDGRCCCYADHRRDRSGCGLVLRHEPVVGRWLGWTSGCVRNRLRRNEFQHHGRDAARLRWGHRHDQCGADPDHQRHLIEPCRA